MNSRCKSSLFLCLFLFLGTETFSSFVWDQRADYGGGIRDFAIGMSIGSKGYAGTGRNPTGSVDFWEYDPVTNAWTQKAPYPGSGRYGMIAFSISHRGYVGLGWSGSGGGAAQYKDFWEYDPTANTWTRKTDF